MNNPVRLKVVKSREVDKFLVKWFQIERHRWDSELFINNRKIYLELVGALSTLDCLFGVSLSRRNSEVGFETLIQTHAEEI